MLATQLIQQGSLLEINAALTGGSVTARALTEASLTQIETLNPSLNAMTQVFPQQALAAADQADARLQQGKNVTYLTGIPVAIKDNLDLLGSRTTCASQLLHAYFPSTDAAVVERLKRAGAIIVGKTNMDELALGSWSLHSAYGRVAHPLDPQRQPGGSSGGSASAVAAGMVPIALGTDTGGSVRQPASLCNLVGLRPTHGIIPNQGLFPSVTAFDTIGPFTRSAMGAAICFQLLSNRDPAAFRLAALQQLQQPLRIAIPNELMTLPLGAGIRPLFEGAIQVFQSFGTALVQVNVPHFHQGTRLYQHFSATGILQSLKHFFNLTKDDPGKLSELITQESVGPEVKARVTRGLRLAAEYGPAGNAETRRARSLFRHRLLDYFDSGVQLIATPTSPVTALTPQEIQNSQHSTHWDLFTIPAAIAGFPALSLPVGFTRDGLPVGLQLMARPGDEITLLRAAIAYEQRMAPLRSFQVN